MTDCIRPPEYSVTIRRPLSPSPLFSGSLLPICPSSLPASSFLTSLDAMKNFIASVVTVAAVASGALAQTFQVNTPYVKHAKHAQHYSITLI